MHVINFLYDGGTETYIHTLVTGMDRGRYDFSICCLVEAGFGAQRFIDAGVAVHTLDVRKGGGLVAKLHNVGQVFRLARLLKRERIDIVHSHDNFPASFARLASLIARIPIVYITYHNIYYWLSPLSHRVNRWLASITTRIVAVSKAVRDQSIATDGIPAEKFCVIYNGIDWQAPADPVAARRHYRDLFGIPQDARVIGNVASLSERKGQALLVEALVKTAKNHADTRLVIVGSERDDEPGIREELQRIAARHGVAERLHFTGSRDDVQDLMSMFDLFVLPSLTEGFGYVLVEAMCAGVPAIASDIPALSEVAAHGQRALLFRSGDSDDLARQLDYALNHPQAMRALADAAYTDASEVFTRAPLSRG